MNTMKISVIIPMYNASRMMGRCVESCGPSHNGALEVLLIDDGSTDDTLKKGEALAEKHSFVRCFRQPHAGVSEARNRGIREARGEWIIFLDADDALCENAIQTLAACMEDPVDACCGGIIRGTEAVKSEVSPPVRRTNRRELLDYVLAEPTDRLTIHGWMFRRSVCLEHGIWFKPALRLGEDSDWVLRYLSACQGATFIIAPVYRYTLSSESTVHNWKPGQTGSYLEALEETGKPPVSEQKNWPLYVLTTLLLILTHDTFHPANPAATRARFQEAKRLRKLPVFMDAFERADLKELGFAKRVTLTCLKWRRYVPVWIAVKLRQQYNAHHQNRE